MKNIENLKNQYEEYFRRSDCGISKGDVCPNGKTGCTCSVKAELKALYDTVIPGPYNTYNIRDFNGLSQGASEPVVSDSSLMQAKQQLLEYCWEDLKVKDMNDISDEELIKKSIIQKRKVEGTDVVIYAESDNENQHAAPKGKTFIASIIMKEAIKSRFLKNDNYGWGTSRGDTYEWIEFSILDNMAKSEDKDLLNAIKAVDWLVIDNIPRCTRPYVRHRIDHVILERESDNLPTIFVCRYDIRVNENEILSGMGLNKVFNDNRNFFIELKR